MRVPETISRILELLAPGAAVAFVIGAMLSASRGSVLLNPTAWGFVLVAVGPYLLLTFLTTKMHHRYGSNCDIVGCVCAVVMLAFAVVVYGEALSSHSSPAALVFVAVPCYSYLGLILHGIAVAVASRIRRPLVLQPLCRHCGYSLTGNISGICPECGNAVDRIA